MIKFQYFPKSKAIPDHLQHVVNIFSQNLDKIDSDNFQHSSNNVLNEVASGLENLGFTVEKSKKKYR